MKFIVSSTALLKNLQALSGVLTANSTLPILDNFIFTLTESELRIKASDMDTTMTVSMIPDKMEEPGEAAVPAKKMIEWLRICPDIPVTINISTDDFFIELTTGEGRFKLAGYNPEDFPKMPEFEKVSSFTLSSDILLSAINKTIFATGNDELRPVMSGVFCSATPEEIVFVATDAHKLVRYARTDAVIEENIDFIFPKKPLLQLKNILSFDVQDIKIDYNEKFIILTFANFEVSCRLIDGKYPNYHAVIPKDNPNEMIVERIPLLNAIQRVSIFASQSTHQVRFKISGQELAISAEDIDYSNEGTERMGCSYNGEDMEIGFNARFLIEMLKNVNQDEVCFQMSQPNRAGLIVPVATEDDTKENILMLVMPVMLDY